MNPIVLVHILMARNAVQPYVPSKRKYQAMGAKIVE